MPLTIVPDILDDTMHHKLDQRVNKVADEDGTPERLTPGARVLILTTIVSSSEGTLKQKYSYTQTARELIKTHPELATMLDDAWKARAYRNIRNLDLLRAVRPSETKRKLLSESWQQGLYKSFCAPYRGRAVDAFYEYLQYYNNEFKRYSMENGNHLYYGKFCSIVQSSGTGKSRLLFELRKKGVIVLYMNIRPGGDLTGFPDRDVVPAKILTEQLPPNPIIYASQCCAFFGAVFKTIQEYLSKLASGRSPEEALRKWIGSICDLLSEEREHFFEALQSNYNEIIALPEIDNAVKVATEKLESSSFSEGEMAMMRMPGHEYMSWAYEKMVQTLSELLPNEDPNKPKLVLALDEAHTLSPMAEKHRSYRPSSILCRAISIYSGVNRVTNYAAWVVFVSTSMRVADLAAPQGHFDSARVHADGQLLFPPFSQLGWDQNASPMEGIAATDVAQADHIIGFGRALWKSVQGMYSVVTLLTMAMDKLSGNSDEPVRSLAILAQRFCLNVTLGHREAVRFVESTVASHLRVCITTTEDRQWSFTTYPSEPVLSCVAASLLHRKEGDLDGSMEQLKKKILTGMVDVGKSGELASRLLWLLAKDLFVRRIPSYTPIIQASDGEGWKAEFADCRMISVLDYFEFVFGKNFWERAGEDAKKAFENAYINFSHWVSMDESISSGDGHLKANEWTLRHWHRTSAVQCTHYQPLVDKMIPIYFNDPEIGTDDLSRVSHIFISDKARSSSSENDLITITRNDPSIKCDSGLPWVAILVDLGLENSRMTASFPERQSPRGTSGPCLRVYAAATETDTFPFLKKSPQTLETLRTIIAHEKIPRNGLKLVQDVQEQTRYGNTATKQHMRWEAWAETA